MLDQQTIEQLSSAVAAKLSGAISIDIALWNTAQAASYLNCGTRQVCERFAALPDFPKAIRLPTKDGGSGHPLWHAHEVVQWAAKYKEGARSSRGRSRKAA